MEADVQPARVDVSRDVIVDATRRAVRQVRAAGVLVPTSLVRRLMRVAREHDEFLMGGWRRGSCGCLIGNLYGDEFSTGRLSQAEYRIGLQFDWVLREHLGLDLVAPMRRRILRVVD